MQNDRKIIIIKNRKLDALLPKHRRKILCGVVEFIFFLNIGFLREIGILVNRNSYMKEIRIVFGK